MNIVIEDVTLGQGPGTVTVGLKFDTVLAMGETKEFVEWLKENDLKNIKVGELPTYLNHWRGLRDED
jgi:hypothetical protein